MPFSMPDIPKEKITIFITMIVIFIAVGIGNFIFKLPDPAPLKIENTVLVRTLEGKGELPPLQDAVAADATLAEMVRKLDAVPAPQLFTRQSDIDLTIVTILFRWAGADMTPENEYGPYIDSRVVSFLKRIGSVPQTVLPGTEIEMTEAGSLNQLWFKAFEHFRTRLLIQSAGKEVYGGQAEYDLKADRVVVKGPVSEDFIQAFEAELQTSDNSGEAMRAFLDFIDVTKGFSALSDAEQDLIMSLDAGQAPDPDAQTLPETPDEAPVAAP